MTLEARRVVPGAALFVLLVVVAACTGGGSFVEGFGSGGSTGASGTPREEAPSVPLPTPGSPPKDPSEVDVPFVACITPPVDRTDAGSGDDAGPDGSGDDAGASPCEAPPRPSCLSKTSMVEYGPGPCVDDQCRFTVDVIDCPGGCFQQLDGGERCNREN